MSPRPTKRQSRHPFGKSALRLVANTFPRFISILLITMIGVAFFSGLRVSGDYMRANANTYLNAMNTMDIRIVSTYGFDADDLRAIRATDGVLDCYPAYNANVLVTVGDSALSCQILSIDARDGAAQNCPWLLEGRLPQAEGECLVEEEYLRDSGKAVGDSVIFSSGDEATDILDSIKRTRFRIVGVVISPLFLAEDRGASEIGDGSNSYFFLLPEQDFCTEVFTEAYIRIAAVDAQDSRFTEEYLAAVTDEIQALEETGSERAPRRLAKIRNDAKAELDDAQREVNDGYDKLADARAELLDARRELDEAWQELDDSREVLDAAWATWRLSRYDIDSGWQTLQESRLDMDEGWSELERSRLLLDDGWAQAAEGQELLDAASLELEQGAEQIQMVWDLLDAVWQTGYVPQWLYDYFVGLIEELERPYQEGLAEYNYNLELFQQSVDELEQGELDYQSGIDKLTAGEAEYSDGVAQLEQAEADYLDGWYQLLDAEAEFEDGRQQLEEAEQDYEEGFATFERERDEALVDLRQAQADINAGRKDLEDLKLPQWYVLGIRDNSGFRTFQNEADQLDALAFILPGCFFLIAALVSMTAMTRLVDAERTTIASFKALGYRNGAITSRYLAYALTATIIGSSLGVALGFTILPPMIFDAFRTLFNIPHSVRPFSFEYTLLSALTAVVSTVLPAMFVVRKSVRETPAQAMRPLAPKAGRRIFMERLKPIWRRLSFLQKVTARNLFRYKKRLLMTVLGVAGCTALVFTALGLNDALGSVSHTQIGKVFLSDVSIDISVDDQAGFDALASRMRRIPEISAYAPILQRSMRIYDADLTKDISLIVFADPDQMPDYILSQARQTGFAPPASYRLTDTGVILTEQVARQFGVSIGDTINLRTLEGDSASFTVTGIVENYTLHYVYMTPSAYASGFGEPTVPNRLLMMLSDSSVRLPPAFIDDAAVVAVLYSADLASSLDTQMDVLNFVVVILIASAGILIFVVLFSLTTINIEERRRELASIEVLGFTDRELAAYIYRENIVLTILGTLLGIGLGFLLQRYIITTLEIDMFMFSRAIFPTSYAISIALTFAFAAAVNLIMYRPLTRIDMVESLKAME